MALFGKKKEEVVKDAPQGEKQNPVVSDALAKDLERVIIRPHVTEKAAHAGEQNVYTFQIDPRANKYDVRDAVRHMFNVTPKKIRIVNRKARPFVSRARNRYGVSSGMKKAYVYLNKGDSIDLV